VIALLKIHLTSARAETAPGSAHALDLTGLQSPDIRLYRGNYFAGFVGKETELGARLGK
jgi:putative acetyltransferase